MRRAFNALPGLPARDAGAGEVGSRAVGIDVEEREEDHFAADEDGGHAELDVVVGVFTAGVDGPSVVKNCENYLRRNWSAPNLMWRGERGHVRFGER